MWKRNRERQREGRGKERRVLIGGKGRVTNIVMIPSPQVNSVNIHPPIISPVVRQRHHKLNPRLGSRIDNLVKPGHINDARPVGVPPLEDRLRATGAFVAVLRESRRGVGYVLVVEAPCAEDFQPGGAGCGHAFFYVCLVLYDISKGRFIRGCETRGSLGEQERLGQVLGNAAG